MNDIHADVLPLTLPERTHRAGAVQLFLYNAAIWNSHRIHYDLPYAQGEEDHPALLVDGPLQGDWLMQLVYDFMGEDDELIAFSYSNRRAAYADEPLSARGEVVEVVEADGARVQLALRIVNAAGDVVTTGKATVRRTAR
jgi:hydroxyacyl-ACP dehydratase HTD2-like protein with hotdog domain